MMGAGMPLTLQGESDELYGVWDVGRLKHAWSSRHLTDVYYSLPHKQCKVCTQDTCTILTLDTHW